MTENRINELENKSVEFTQSEQNIVDQNKQANKGTTLRSLRDYRNRRSSLHRTHIKRAPGVGEDNVEEMNMYWKK